MKAVICPKYGPPEVLKIVEVRKPAPKDDEVLIEIYSSAVTASDIYIRGSKLPLHVWIPMRIMLGLTKPRRSVIGLVYAGKVESVGKNIKRFRAGDEVYGLTGFSLGTYAEYICLKEVDSMHGTIAIKPQSITFEEATVAAYGGLLAFQSLEKGGLNPGQNILIYGASGTTGTIAVQYAKSIGAKVTGVCSSSNIELVKSLGADVVIDYTKENRLPEGVSFDLILDAVGKSKSSALKKACKKALSQNGKYVSIDDGSLVQDSNRLARIKDFIDKGNIKPFIDRVYPFEEIVEAHRYVEKGHKRGGVVIKIK